jgi:hypothetical protein
LVLAGQVKGRGQLGGACIKLRPVAGQEADQGGVAVQRGHMERGEAVGVGAVHPHTAALHAGSLAHTMWLRLHLCSLVVR